jgi:choline dehydrogenase-like flavoprotein
MGVESMAIDHACQRPGTWALYDRPMGSVDHETCTHAIGKVCEEDLSLSEIPGVFLNGPGVFPRAGAANPGLTMLALSDWLAASIKQRFA